MKKIDIETVDIGRGCHLRQADYALDEEQRALRDSFASLFSRECPRSLVRQAEPLGFDQGLWRHLVRAGVLTMGTPTGVGGDGAGLVELALIAEQAGVFLAPVPLLECLIATRLLARSGSEVGLGWWQTVVNTGQPITLALRPIHFDETHLIPAGPLAVAVVALVNEDLVIVSPEHPLPLVRNLGSAPLARWSPSVAHQKFETVLRGSPAVTAFTEAVREWKLLMAATQTGIAAGALDLAVQYAQQRIAFNAPIGRYQGISHPLVDCHIATIASRRLVWKAAWLADHEPHEERHLIPMAFAYSTRNAARTTSVAVHTQGGIGFTLESDIQLYFRRAKGWANIAGDPSCEIDLIADALYGPTDEDR